MPKYSALEIGKCVYTHNANSRIQIGTQVDTCENHLIRTVFECDFVERQHWWIQWFHFWKFQDDFNLLLDRFQFRSEKINRNSLGLETQLHEMCANGAAEHTIFPTFLSSIEH